MDETSFLSLIQNAALLLALVFIFDVVGMRLRRGQFSFHHLPIGLSIGVIGTVIMLTPWVLTPGIIFDTRSILLGISGLFFGTIPTIIAMLMTASLRIYQGGAGIPMGISVIFTTGTIGIAWRHLRKQPLDKFTWSELYLFGFIIHFVMLLCTFTLPLETALQVLANIILPVLVIYPLGTAFLGTLLANRIRREKLADKIREDETRFKIVADNTYDWEYWLDPSNQFIYCSPSCYNLTGFSQHEFMQDSSLLDRIIHPEDQAMFRQHRCDAFTGESKQVEFRIIRADSSICWISHACVPVYDSNGKFLGIRGSNRDNSKHKQAEQALRESEEKYRLLVENLTDIIIKTDPEGKFLFASPSYCQLYGQRIEDLLGKTFIPQIHEDDLPIAEKAMVTVYQPPYRCSYEERAKTVYGWRWLEWDVRAVQGDEGRIIALVGTGRDITERKQAEQKIQMTQHELEKLLQEAEQSRWALLSLVEDQKIAEEQIRQLNSELEQRVQQRTAQLEAANKELEAFSYSVSHDLRAPLRALNGFSSALLEDYRDRLDNQGQDYLQRIRAASNRMDQLINDLLSLSRITISEFKNQKVNFSALAREISVELQSLDPGRQIEFEIAPDLVVNGDLHLLRIALGNLLNNAYKFTSKGTRTTISFSMTEQKGERVFFVRDNGTGFDMAYSGKLFSPFQRLHLNSEYEGTGIGLTIVHRIVTRHGGRIWAESQVNQGATFYFTLG